MSDDVKVKDIVDILAELHEKVLESPYIDSLPYRREVTNRAARHGWREKDVAYNVAFRAAIEASERKEESA